MTEDERVWPTVTCGEGKARLVLRGRSGALAAPKVIVIPCFLNFYCLTYKVRHLDGDLCGSFQL